MVTNVITGVPNLKEDTPEEELENLINVSKLIQLPYLATICENKKRDEEFLNPSIGTYLNDETGKRMKDLFLNKPTLADIYFIVEGKSFLLIMV